MTVYYKSIEVHGNQFGRGLEVYKSRKGREILVPGYGVLRISPKEMKYTRIEEVPRVEMKRMTESAVILYLERLGILYEGYEDRAERLLREWERVGKPTRFITRETAVKRLQECLQGTGYGRLMLSMLTPKQDSAMTGIAIEKRFTFTESTKNFVRKCEVLGVDMSVTRFKFSKELKQGLDAREILHFKGDSEKQYLVEGKPMGEIYEFFYINDYMEVVARLNIKRPLMLTENGIQIYMEYLNENFRYGRG